MPVRLMYATATIKARSYFTCSTPGCNREEQGSTFEMRREDDKVGVPALTFDQAQAHNVSARHMPVGWASFGQGIVRCPDHHAHGYKGGST